MASPQPLVLLLTPTLDESQHQLHNYTTSTTTNEPSLNEIGFEDKQEDQVDEVQEQGHQVCEPVRVSKGVKQDEQDNDVRRLGVRGDVSGVGAPVTASPTVLVGETPEIYERIHELYHESAVEIRYAHTRTVVTPETEADWQNVLRSCNASVETVVINKCCFASEGGTKEAAFVQAFVYQAKKDLGLHNFDWKAVQDVEEDDKIEDETLDVDDNEIERYLELNGVNPTTSADGEHGGEEDDRTVDKKDDADVDANDVEISADRPEQELELDMELDLDMGAEDVVAPTSEREKEREEKHLPPVEGKVVDLVVQQTQEDVIEEEEEDVQTPIDSFSSPSFAFIDQTPRCQGTPMSQGAVIALTEVLPHPLQSNPSSSLRVLESSDGLGNITNVPEAEEREAFIVKETPDNVATTTATATGTVTAIMEINRLVDSTKTLGDSVPMECSNGVDCNVAAALEMQKKTLSTAHSADDPNPKLDTVSIVDERKMEQKQKWDDFLQNSRVNESHIIHGKRTRAPPPKFVEYLKQNKKKQTTTTTTTTSPTAAAGKSKPIPRSTRRQKEGRLSKTFAKPVASVLKKDSISSSQKRSPTRRVSPRKCPEKVSPTKRGSSNGKFKIEDSGTHAMSSTVFSGMDFLLSGFTSKEKEKICDDIRSHQGNVMESIPSPNDFEDVIALEHSNIVVVAKDKTATLKYLFGLCANYPVVKLEWLNQSMKNNFPVEMKRSLVYHLPTTAADCGTSARDDCEVSCSHLMKGSNNNESRNNSRKKLFSDRKLLLCGSASFVSGSFKDVLTYGGATVMTLEEKEMKVHRRKRRRYQLSDDGQPLAAIIVEREDLVKDTSPSAFFDQRHLQNILIIDKKVFVAAIQNGNTEKIFKDKVDRVARDGRERRESESTPRRQKRRTSVQSGAILRKREANQNGTIDAEPMERETLEMRKSPPAAKKAKGGKGKGDDEEKSQCELLRKRLLGSLDKLKQIYCEENDQAALQKGLIAIDGIVAQISAPGAE